MSQSTHPHEAGQKNIENIPNCIEDMSPRPQQQPIPSGFLLSSELPCFKHWEASQMEMEPQPPDTCTLEIPEAGRTSFMPLEGMEIEADVMPEVFSELTDQKLEAVHTKINTKKCQYSELKLSQQQLCNEYSHKIKESRQSQGILKQALNHCEEPNEQMLQMTQFKNPNHKNFQSEENNWELDLGKLNPHSQNDNYLEEKRQNILSVPSNKVNQESQNIQTEINAESIQKSIPHKKVKRDPISLTFVESNPSGSYIKIKKERPLRTSSKSKKKQKTLNSPYSISVEKRNIKRVRHPFQNKKILKKIQNIVNDLKKSIKIMGYRNSGEQGQYLFKFGNTKVWLSIREAIEKGFNAYYRQLRQYKKTAKQYISQENNQSFIKLQTTVKISQVKKQPRSNQKDRRLLELEDSPAYQRQLKIIFDEILINKYIAFEKLKAYKEEIKKAKTIEVQSELSFSQSEEESQYIPNAGQFKRFLEDIVEESNRKIKNKLTPKRNNEKISKYFTKKQEYRQASHKKMSSVIKSPLNTKVIQHLNQFQETLNYVEDVDQIVGKLSKEHIRLACLDGSGGLGLRSSHRVEELTREEYIRELVEQQNPPEIDLIDSASKSLDPQAETNQVEQKTDINCKFQLTK